MMYRLCLPEPAKHQVRLLAAAYHSHQSRRVGTLLDEWSVDEPLRSYVQAIHTVETAARGRLYRAFEQMAQFALHIAGGSVLTTGPFQIRGGPSRLEASLHEAAYRLAELALLTPESVADYWNGPASRKAKVGLLSYRDCISVGVELQQSARVSARRITNCNHGECILARMAISGRSSAMTAIHGIASRKSEC